MCSTLSNKYGEGQWPSESRLISAEIGNMFVLKIDVLNTLVLLSQTRSVVNMVGYLPGTATVFIICLFFRFQHYLLRREESREQWITIFREGFALHPDQTPPNKYLSTVNKILATTWNIKCSILPLHNRCNINLIFTHLLHFPVIFHHH